QADCTRVRARVGLELRLLVDDRRQQGGIQAVVARMAADDLLVTQRVPEPLPPARLGRLEHGERPQQPTCEHQDRQNSRHAMSRAITSATNASSSSSVPSFTYA